MENSSGFVYVMINTSYTGLVKIGKTTKDPDERAKELSSATGVVTPFIVVYKRQFNNCHVAEKVIHNILEEQGYRVNSSREFFSIDITEAINLIMTIPNEDNNNFIDDCVEDNSLNDNLADSFYEKATDYYYGTEDVFEDIDLALEYFEKSASLGKAEAYLKIGDIWRNRGNMRQAINSYKKGIDNDCLLCYGKLGEIFNDEDSGFYNKRNAELAYKKFFEYVDNSKGLHLDIDFAWEHMEIGFIVHQFLFVGVLNNDISLELEEFLIKYTPQIKTHFEKSLIYLQESNPETANFLESKLRPYINKLVEKHAVYGLEGDELAKKYFSIAKENFKDIENSYSSAENANSEKKTFELFSKSAELGYQIAKVYLGICWLYRGGNLNKLSPEKQRKSFSILKAEKAWKTFYNYAYNTFTEQQTMISEEQKEEILEGFTLIIYYAIRFNVEHLIHEYYVLLALYLGIIDYYSKRIDLLASKECYKLDDSFEFKPFELNKLDISNHSDASDLIDQTNMILDYFESEKERKQIETVHSYVKNFALKMKDKFGSQTKFMIYPLDI